MSDSPYSVSVVIPFYNEEDCVDEMHRRLDAVMAESGHPYELVYVDDGSADKTLERLKAVADASPRVRVVQLAGNYGQTAALSAGFECATGDVFVAMDGDLQHEPEEMPRFLEGIDAGFDIVSGWRQSRPESLLLRRIPSWAANRLMSWVSGVKIHDFGTTFKAYRREVIERITLYGDFHRFIPALAKPLRVTMTEVPIHAAERAGGKTNYGISRTFTVFFDILRIKFLLSFMSRPLQFFGTGGLALMIAGMGMGLFLAKEKYLSGVPIMVERGPFFIVTIFLLLAGIQLLSIGFLGEILARLYFESRPEANYRVRKISGQGLA